MQIQLPRGTRAKGYKTGRDTFSSGIIAKIITTEVARQKSKKFACFTNPQATEQEIKICDWEYPWKIF